MIYLFVEIDTELNCIKTVKPYGSLASAIEANDPSEYCEYSGAEWVSGGESKWIPSDCSTWYGDKAFIAELGWDEEVTL